MSVIFKKTTASPNGIKLGGDQSKLMGVGEIPDIYVDFSSQDKYSSEIPLSTDAFSFQFSDDSGYEIPGDFIKNRVWEINGSHYDFDNEIISISPSSMTPGQHYFSIKLTLTDKFGRSKTKIDSDYINIDSPEIINISYTQGNTIFDYDFMSSINEITFHVDTYTWEFGDGNTSNEESPQHSYSNGGSYQVKLTIQDIMGNTSDYETPLNIQIESPQASGMADMTDVTTNDYVNFSDMSTEGSFPITQWEWDFGDGMTSFDQNPSYQYMDAGYYSVTLTVSDDYGNSDQTNVDIINVTQG